MSETNGTPSWTTWCRGHKHFYLRFHHRANRQEVEAAGYKWRNWSHGVCPWALFECTANGPGCKGTVLLNCQELDSHKSCGCLRRRTWRFGDAQRTRKRVEVGMECGDFRNLGVAAPKEHGSHGTYLRVLCIRPGGCGKMRVTRQGKFLHSNNHCECRRSEIATKQFTKDDLGGQWFGNEKRASGKKGTALVVRLATEEEKRDPQLNRGSARVAIDPSAWLAECHYPGEHDPGRLFVARRGSFKFNGLDNCGCKRRIKSRRPGFKCSARPGRPKGTRDTEKERRNVKIREERAAGSKRQALQARHKLSRTQLSDILAGRA